MLYLHKITRLGGACLLGILLALPATADVKADLAALKPADFPTDTIEINVVYPAGGGMDLNARILARSFERITGHKVVVNNRTGGAGLVGHAYLATQAPKDGHSVGVIANLMFADAMLRANGAWSHTDFDAIAYLNSDGLILATNPEAELGKLSMKELLEKAKAEPGTIRIVNVPGSMYEYMVEQMEKATGASFLKVPFQGGAPGVAALMGNNVDVAIAFLGEVRSHIDAGRVRPVAVSGAERSPFVDAPTLNEVLERDDIVWQATRWVALPAGVAADRQAYLSAAFIAAAADEETQKEFAALGATTNVTFDSADKVQAQVSALADLEKAFFTETGRLK